MEWRLSDATFEMDVCHWRLDLNAENMSGPGFDLTLGPSLHSVDYYIPRSSQSVYIYTVCYIYTYILTLVLFISTIFPGP